MVSSDDHRARLQGSENDYFRSSRELLLCRSRRREVSLWLGHHGAGICSPVESAQRAVASTANFCYLSPMILRPGQVIAGRPAKDIRKLLREIRHLQVSCAYARHVLRCSAEEATQIVSALQREGYLSRAGRDEGHDLYERRSGRRRSSTMCGSDTSWTRIIRRQSAGPR